MRDVGAYGMSLSSNYNVRPKPAELLIEGSKIRVINPKQIGQFVEKFKRLINE